MFFVDLLNNISNNLRFIALHITCVNNNPEAPTIPPILTNKASEIARPAIAAATPLKLLSNEIVIGISAPPTRILKNKPNNDENTDNEITNIVNIISSLINTNPIMLLKVNINDIKV